MAMKPLVIATAALLLTAGATFAKDPAPPAKSAAGSAPKPAAQPAPTKADPLIDATLDGLDQVGRNLREFTSKLESTETNLQLGDFSKSTGRAWYQKRG